MSVLVGVSRHLIFLIFLFSVFYPEFFCFLGRQSVGEGRRHRQRPPLTLRPKRLGSLLRQAAPGICFLLPSEIILRLYLQIFILFFTLEFNHLSQSPMGGSAPAGLSRRAACERKSR